MARLRLATSAGAHRSRRKAGTDTREAKALGAYCAATKSTNGPRSEAEDCLFINVWRPSDVSADARLPVYVFIHRGRVVDRRAEPG